MDKVNKYLDKNNNLKLQQEYIKALKDKDFVKVVNELDCKEEVLMKYTSRLEECANENRNCANCKGLIECKNKIIGYILKAKKSDSTLSFEYNACKYTKKEEYKDNITLFDIPREIRNASIKDIYTDDKNRLEIIKKIKSFYKNYFTDKKDKGIYLYGSFGCGKTYILSALLNEFAKKDVRSIIVHVPELLRDLKDSFNSDYHDKYIALKTTPILLLDDIGAEYLTKWTRDEILEPLLQYRMNENLPTFLLLI